MGRCQLTSLKVTLTASARLSLRAQLRIKRTSITGTLPPSLFLSGTLEKVVATLAAAAISNALSSAAISTAAITLATSTLATSTLATAPLGLRKEGGPLGHHPTHDRDGDEA